MSSWSTKARAVLGGDRAGLEARVAHVEAEVAALREAIAESQRLNERLSDVLDVVTELLVPAVDRDEERLSAALASADRVVGPLSASPRTP